MGSFKVNTLCRKHNSLLSSVDQEAIRLSNAVKKAYAVVNNATIHNEPLVFEFDGGLLERWFLKSFITLCIRDCGGWTWLGGRPLNDPTPYLVRAAFGLESLKPPMGLYDMNLPGRERMLTDTYGVMTVANDRNEIMGGRFDFHMLLYAMWVSDGDSFPDPSKGGPWYEGIQRDVGVTHHNRAGLFTRRDGSARCEFRVAWNGEE